MHTIVDKFKINALKTFEKVIPKFSTRNCKQGKSLTKYLRFFKFS